jgi:type VI secretion system secreted protein VgrG
MVGVGDPIMPYLEKNRYLNLLTPLGADKLFLLAFSGHEGLSQLFQFHLSVLAENSSPLKFESLLSKSVAFGIQGDLKLKLKPRAFHGTVIQISQGARDQDFTEYELVVAPAIWALTRRFGSRLFQHLNVKDILEQIFAGFEVDDQIQGDFKPREYCTQYQETDFDFASRLMEEEGIYYFFKFVDGTHKLVLANTPQSHPDLLDAAKVIYEEVEGGGRDEERVSEWHKAQNWGSGKVTLWDHHFELPHKHLEADKTVQPTVKAGKASHKFNLGGNDALEVYENSGRYAQRFDGIDKSGGEKAADLSNIYSDNKRTAAIRIEEIEHPLLAIHGAGTHRQFTAGYKFTLQRHYDADDTYVLREVTHSAEEADFRSGGGRDKHYSNSFTCFPLALPFRPPRVTRRPLISGPLSAVVVGPAGEEIFPDKYGRVKVQFHWDREGKSDLDSSCWLRVVTPWAGKQWGMITIPRIGHEVIVEFLEGDPDRPIIIGSVYNAHQMPPYPLPAEKTKSTIKSLSSPGGGGFNEFRFEDKAGKEQIFIHAQRNQDIRVKNDLLEFVGNDSHRIVTNDHMEQVKGDQHLTVTGDQNEKIDGTVSLKAGMNYEAKVGTNYELDAGMEIYAKAGVNLVIESGTTLTLKVGGNFININPGGVFISGTMVMINSGGAAGSGAGANPTPPKPPKEADDATPGDKSAPPPEGPQPPTIYSPQAQALALASESGAPFCEL